MIRRMGQLVQSGVQVIGLLSLSDDGKPSFDEQNASLLHRLGIPCFACTPDQFPGLMATALERKDLASWAARQEIVLQR